MVIHNDFFEITGNKLMLLEATNYFLQSEYLIRVFARDQLNSKSESSLIIIVDPPSGSDQFGIPLEVMHHGLMTFMTLMGTVSMTGGRRSRLGHPKGLQFPCC